MSSNRSNMWHIFRARSVFRTGSIALLTGCLWFSIAPFASAQADPAAQQAAPGDGDIQSNVAYALTHDPSLQGQQIATTTSQGQVTLSGTVQTNAQRQQAETLAANVSGVSGILNNIKVTNPNSPIPVAAPAQQDQVQDQAQDQAPPPPPDQAPNAQAPAPNQGYSQPAPTYSGARPPYQSQQGYPAPQQSYNQPPPPPSGPVTIPAGTLMRVRLSETLDTAHLASGSFFQATAAADVYQGGVLAIPRGAVLTGQVVESKKGGDLGGAATLRLDLTSLNLEGRTYPLATEAWSNKGPNKAGYTAANTVGGAAIGALIGGIIGRGAGAAIGAGVGGAAGLAGSAASNGPRLILPTETAIDFHLTNPITVQPVSWQEAQRLATTSTPQPPRLIRRPYPYPYGYPPPPPGYYGYPY